MDGVVDALSGSAALPDKAAAGMGDAPERLVAGLELTSARALEAHASGTATAAQTIAAPAFTRTNPFSSEVLENFNLNGRGSDKETRHLKLAIEGSGLCFEPGDSLGIYPHNDPQLVDEVIAHMGWNSEEVIPAGKQELPLREALIQHYEITLLSKQLLKQAAAFSQDGLQDLIQADANQKLKAYTRGRDLLDLVRDFSIEGIPPREFVPMLRKLPARLYSIASSFRANSGEVDLLVAALRYQAHNRDRLGTCSVHCAERVDAGDFLQVFVHSNPNFRQPADADVPIIMVGPGTGVAPFRAFVEDREESGAGGKSWLFFGDRRFRTDFLYQVEWLRWLKLGVLDAIGRGLLARSGRQGLRAAPHAGEEPRAVRLVAGRGPFLRLRQRQPDGGRRPLPRSSASSREKAANRRKMPRPTWPACASRAATREMFIRFGVRRFIAAFNFLLLRCFMRDGTDSVAT